MDIRDLRMWFADQLKVLGFGCYNIDTTITELATWLYNRMDGTCVRVDVTEVVGSDREFFNVWMCQVGIQNALDRDIMGNGFIHESVYGIEEAAFLVAVLAKTAF